MKTSPRVQGGRAKDQKTRVALVVLLMSCVNLGKLLDLSGLATEGTGHRLGKSPFCYPSGPEQNPRRALAHPTQLLTKPTFPSESLAPGTSLSPSHNAINGPSCQSLVWILISEMSQIMRKWCALGYIQSLVVQRATNHQETEAALSVRWPSQHSGQFCKKETT